MLLNLHWGYVENDRNVSIPVRYGGNLTDPAEVIVRLREVVLDGCKPSVSECCQEAIDSLKFKYPVFYCPSCGTRLKDVYVPSEDRVENEVDRFWRDTADAFADMWDRLSDADFEIAWDKDEDEEQIDVLSFLDICLMTGENGDDYYPRGMNEDISARLEDLIRGDGG